MNIKQACALRIKQIRTLHKILLEEQSNASEVITNDLTSPELVDVLLRRSRVVNMVDDFGNITHKQAADLVQALFLAMKEKTS